LIGFEKDKEDFFNTVSILLLIGVTISFWLGVSQQIVKKYTVESAIIRFIIIISATVCAAGCIVFIIFPFLKMYLFCYIVLFGIFFAYIMFMKSR